MAGRVRLGSPILCLHHQLPPVINSCSAAAAASEAPSLPFYFFFLAAGFFFGADFFLLGGAACQSRDAMLVRLCVYRSRPGLASASQWPPSTASMTLLLPVRPVHLSLAHWVSEALKIEILKQLLQVIHPPPPPDDQSITFFF